MADKLLSFNDLQALIESGDFSLKNPFTPSDNLADKLEVLDALQIALESNIFNLADNQLVALIDIDSRLTEWIGLNYYCELGAPPVDTAPTDPTISLVERTHSTVKIGWTGASDDIEVLAYQLYVDGVLFTTVSKSVVNFTFIDLAVSTLYRFVVIAVDGVPQTSPGDNFLDVTTLALPVNTVTAPTLGAVVGVGENTFQLDFSGATATAGIKGYNIYIYDTLTDFIATSNATIIGEWISALREGNSSIIFIETVDINDVVSPTKYRMPDDLTTPYGYHYSLFFPIDDLPAGELAGASRCLEAPDFVFHTTGAIAEWRKGSVLLGYGASIVISMPSRTSTYYAYVDTNGDGLLTTYTRIISVENCNLQ